ncbi:MAG: hypothetical protein IPG54_00100 [Sphingomonadales bacterium]|jgi:hypothetical protein|nr:hypothetical protein [Sphingomonadales bacterium]MBK9003887.1 hypothetical protein [Sphingomonadales bacterium]MBK9269063.1 hypothetical protein [Sphingomonadales bacterium]MBP6435128.1 hypothetical protein [Sphingorhabdus sp.]
MKAQRIISRPSVFGWPILIGVLGVGGIVVGLLGEGVLDWLCWAGTGIALIPVGRVLSRRSSGRSETRDKG